MSGGTQLDTYIAPDGVRRSAAVSECGTYRYALSRRWDDDRGEVLFIGLNPSTADGRRDDPTIRRCIRFARDWGYGGLLMANLFAYRASSPGVVTRVRRAVGPENDTWLESLAASASGHVAAWGAHRLAHATGRDREVIALLDGVVLRALGLTRAGHPRHPLYVRADVELIAFEGSDDGDR